MDDLTPPEEWVDRAKCRGMDPEVFYPERGEGAARARAVCALCPVLVECREWAIAEGEKFGIWGGTSPRERQRIRRTRRRYGVQLRLADVPPVPVERPVVQRPRRSPRPVVEQLVLFTVVVTAAACTLRQPDARAA